MKAPNSVVEPSGGRVVNSSVKTPVENLSKSERDLSRIVALVGGLGLGATLAFSEALRIEDETFSLHFSVPTVATFVLGFAAAYVYLSRILAHVERTSRLFARGGLMVILFLILAAFIYPLRFSTDKLIGRVEGISVALCAMAVGLTLIRSVVRAAEREEAEQEAKERIGPDGAESERDVARSVASAEPGQSNPRGESADGMTAARQGVGRSPQRIAAADEHGNKK
ncbi:MAG TPA: hypothetical protein VFY06_02515 [Verrucomicrobiae bacterium]|nr:hypothetical protein [Verrucomicrobiae bacterium]